MRGVVDLDGSAARNELDEALGPLARAVRVVVAAHDERVGLHGADVLLDAVAHHARQGLEDPARAAHRVRHPDEHPHRARFVERGVREAKDLLGDGAGVGVDDRADEDERGELGAAGGKLRGDLSAHRVTNDDGVVEAEVVDDGARDLGEVADVERAVAVTHPAEPGQVDGVDRTGGVEVRREAYVVVRGDADAGEQDEVPACRTLERGDAGLGRAAAHATDGDVLALHLLVGSNGLCAHVFVTLCMSSRWGGLADRPTAQRAYPAVISAAGDGITARSAAFSCA